MTVPESDTGRLPENGKAIERNLAKELGNLTPYVRKKGSLGAARCHGRSETAPETV